VTFGNAFGLCLYDHEQRQVRRRRKPQSQVPPMGWPLRSLTGEVIKSYAEPAQLCSALRKALEGCTAAANLTALWAQNGSVLAALQYLPQLKSERGEHYAEILASLYRKRRQELERREEPSMDGLPAFRPRRIRDKAHLRRVAQQPCLVCGRLPAHAHHLKFLEPRGLGLKPSDAFAVPLCRLHHRALHDQGDEQSWWQQHKIDPVSEAQRLWRGETPVAPPLA
jgi:hypothetical protein